MEAIKIEPVAERPTTAGMTTKVVKGSLWTLVGQILPLGVTLITTPFVIRMLGAEGYGVLILVGLIPTYFGFADFGMSIASTKLGSEAFAANDPDREARVVRTAAVIAFLTSVPIAGAIIGFSVWIVTVFNVPPALQPEAALALKFAAITFVINFLNGIFNTPQLARLRMDLNTLVTSGFRIIGIIATPIVIYLGGGILGAVVVLMIASVLTFAGHIYISGRLLPSLLGFTLDRRVIRPLLKFGGTIVLALAAGILLTNLEKLVLPKMTSVEVFAYYSVAFTLATMITLFSNSMMQSLIPAFSRMMALRETNEVQELYSRAIRINLILFLPVASLLILVARPFFTIWAGPNFGEQSSGPFYILLIGLLFSFSATVSGAAIIAAQKTLVSAMLYWAELLPSLLLAIVLTDRWGALGAALAWTLRVVVDSIGLHIIVKKVIGINFRTDRTQMVYLIVSALALMAAPFLMIVLQLSQGIVFAFAFGGILTYVVVTWKKVVTPLERRQLKTKLSKLVGVLQ